MRAALAVLVVFVSGGCAQIAGLKDPTPPGADGNGCQRTCDVQDNCGCTAAQTCSWDSTAGDPYCRDQNGASARGQGCAKDTDCVQGTSCVFGECRQYCTGDGTCGATTCTADWTGFYPGLTCADDCTPVSNASCPGSSACLIIQGKGATFCLTGDTVAVGADCTSAPFSCVTGAVCHDESGAHVCRVECDPAGAACAAGTCVTAPDLIVKGTQYGVCM